MGQKVNPVGLRIGIIKTWDSRWYTRSKKEYREWLMEDFKIREYLESRYGNSAQISKIEIERTGPNAVSVIIKCVRPGIIVGKKSAEFMKIREELGKMLGKRVRLWVEDVKNPAIDAKVIARNVARQIEQRIPYKRAMKRAILRAMQAGAKGIKIKCSGRLGGAEIARSEWYIEGRMPLQTLRADVDYALEVAITKYGTIGVKVWVFKGEVLEDRLADYYKKQVEEAGKTKEEQ